MAIGDKSLYQTLVGRLQEAKVFFIKDGGKLEGDSGGIAELEAGFLFYLEDSDGELDVADWKMQMVDRINTVTYGPASVSTTVLEFSVLNLPSTVGVVHLSMTSNLIIPSFAITSVVAGQDVWIRLVAGSTESGAVNLVASGCSLVGKLGFPITSITLYNSAASTPAVHLHSFKDDEWAVVDWLGDGYDES